jgi:DNA-binding transcriptional regulator WhiA
MSFSGNVKDELAGHLSAARHCHIAELAAILQFCGKIVRKQTGETVLCIETENESVIKKCFTLLRKTFNIEATVWKSDENCQKKLEHSTIEITDPDVVWNIFQAMKMVGDNGVFYVFDEPVNPLLIKNACWRSTGLYFVQ